MVGSVSETNPELILGSVPKHAVLSLNFFAAATLGVNNCNISVLFLQLLREKPHQGVLLCVLRVMMIVELWMRRTRRSDTSSSPLPHPS